MKIKKTAIVLLLTASMALAGCENGANQNNTSEPTPSVTEEPTTDVTPMMTPTEAPSEKPTEALPGSVDLSVKKEEDGTLYAGEITASTGKSSVNTKAYAGVAGKDYTDPEVYTYRDYITEASSLHASTFAPESESDRTILSYTSSGYYDFVPNETKDGWSVLCEMAQELPADVTKDYVGRYGIEEGDTAKAWKIVLRKGLCWDDGTAIDASTVIYSAMELLNPKMQNQKAEALTSGTFEIYNARSYYHSGRTSREQNSPDGRNAAFAWEAKIAGKDGVYTTPGGAKLYFGLKTGYAWLGGMSIEQFKDRGQFPEEVYNQLAAKADKEGYVPVSDKTIELLFAFTGSDYWGNEKESDLAYYVSFDADNSVKDWTEVGFFMVDTYTFVFVTARPVADAEIAVPEFLTTAYLVKPELWESCKTYYNAKNKQVDKDSDGIVAITTDYGTSLEKTAGFGPYKLTLFKANRQIEFERNEQWFGYTDGLHKGQYQADRISLQVLAEHRKQTEAFRKGELDRMDLIADDLKTYGNSEYLRFTPLPYTTKITFNTNAESLGERKGKILANETFRKAFSAALNRAKFATYYTAAGNASLGLLGRSYIGDATGGAVYRETDGAKKALVGLYGVKYGNDEEYKTLDEAYAAVTGYDIEAARAYMQQAYRECVLGGLYNGYSEVEIELLLAGSEDIYNAIAEFLSDALETACEGTDFAGKIRIKTTVDPNFYQTMRSGGADMILSTWGGSVYETYGVLFECYCDDATGAGNQLEYGYDTAQINVKLRVNGIDYTAPLRQWALWMDGTDETCVIAAEDGSNALAEFSEYDAATRAEIFGLMEKVYLSGFAAIPLYDRNDVMIVSQKGDFATSRYIDRAGFGGLRYYTFRHTDEEWKKAAKEAVY